MRRSGRRISAGELPLLLGHQPLLTGLVGQCSDPWPPDTDPSPGGHAGYSPIAAVKEFKDL